MSSNETYEQDGVEAVWLEKAAKDEQKIKVAGTVVGVCFALDALWSLKDGQIGHVIDSGAVSVIAIAVARRSGRLSEMFGRQHETLVQAEGEEITGQQG